MPYSKENKTIQTLFPKILETAEIYFDNTKKIVSKTYDGDIFTEADTELDALIKKTIAKHFPQDTIMSEESSPNKKLGSGERGWIIDPLCGSMCYSRGIYLYATNIILVENKKVVASWIVDHPKKDILWSVGGNTVYKNKNKLPRLKKSPQTWIIDVNAGYWATQTEKFKQKYAQAHTIIMMPGHVWLTHFATSLSFAYVATGQVQAILCPNVKPWDILGSCFLVEQNGGIASHLDGSPWGISSTEALLAGCREVYDFVMNSLKTAGIA